MYSYQKKIIQDIEKDLSVNFIKEKEAIFAPYSETDDIVKWIEANNGLRPVKNWGEENVI